MFKNYNILDKKFLNIKQINMKNTMKSSLKYQLFLLGMVVLSSFSCKTTTEKKADATNEVTAAPQLKLSLAQWSIHRMIFEDNVDPYTFAQKAHDWGFEGLEYVSALYYKELQAANFSKEAMDHFVEKSNAEAKKYGMTNVLIMIDGQGNLATTDAQERKSAVENHYKWVDAAAAMGCHSIRVNLSGSTDLEIWSPAAVDGLTQLGTYAADKNINIIVENHGGLSSNADYLTAVMAEVNMDNVGHFLILEISVFENQIRLIGVQSVPKSTIAMMVLKN